MPRNPSSGVYSLPETPFIAGTTIESDAVNSNFSDIATALTQSLDTGGVSTMTGPIKAAAGTETAPSYTFSGSQGTGFYLSDTDEISWTANGIQRGVFRALGSVSLAGALAIGGDLTVTGSTGFSADVGVLGDLGVAGVIAAATGSVSAPSYSFLNNLGTGLFISATNQLTIAAASASAATIRASASTHFTGNVSVSGNAEIYGTLVVLGSVSVNQSGLVLLNSGTVNNAATLDIVLTSFTAYRSLKLVLSTFIPASDDVELWLRTSTNGGSSYDSGASDYAYSVSGLFNNGTDAAIASPASTRIVLAGNTGATLAISNVANRGGVRSEVNLYNQVGAHFGSFLYSSVYASAITTDTNSVAVPQYGAGTRIAASDVDAIRVLFETGNIASGNWALYGYA